MEEKVLKVNITISDEGVVYVDGIVLIVPLWN